MRAQRAAFLTGQSGTQRSASPIRRWVMGQSSDPLSTTVLPHASGMSTARTPSMTDAFQGAIPTTTPAGGRISIGSAPGLP